jgi:hypothetical protein
MTNNFQHILEDVLNEKKSVMSFLTTNEIRQLERVFKTIHPEITMQEIDESDLFDKLLQHFLGNRPASIIPSDKTEGKWIVHQLEFDSNFVKRVLRKQ